MAKTRNPAIPLATTVQKVDLDPATITKGRKKGPRWINEVQDGIPIPRRAPTATAWRVNCAWCMSPNGQMTLSASGAYNAYCFDCKARTHFASLTGMALFRAWQRYLASEEARNYLSTAIGVLFREEATIMGLPMNDAEDLPPLIPE